MQACEERLTFRVIAGDDIPNFRTISDFRKQHLKALEDLFVQVLQLCQKAGLVKLGHIALDGTKVKANASRHKAMSYGRMKQEEKRLKEEIHQLLSEAEAVDQQEDREYGSDRRGDELPKELARRESRLKRIQQAKKALEAEAKAAAEQARKEREADCKKRDKPKGGRRPKPISDIPADNKQYNFTDPDSKIMKVNNKGWDQCANAQAAVDSHKQIIVACDVTDETNDKRQFEPMLEKAQENVGKDKRIKAASADTGYYSESNIEYAEDKEIDAYIATGKVKHNAPPAKAPCGRMPKYLTTKEKMARKLRPKRAEKLIRNGSRLLSRYLARPKGPEDLFSFRCEALKRCEVSGRWYA